MKRVALLTLLLAGCAHPEPVVEVREVPVISPVRCVDPSKIPPEPRRVSNRFNGDARHDLEVLAVSARDLRKWGQDMRALLEPCIGKPPEQATQPAQPGAQP